MSTLYASAKYTDMKITFSEKSGYLDLIGPTFKVAYYCTRNKGGWKENFTAHQQGAAHEYLVEKISLCPHKVGSGNRQVSKVKISIKNENMNQDFIIPVDPKSQHMHQDKTLDCSNIVLNKDTGEVTGTCKN